MEDEENCTLTAVTLFINLDKLNIQMLSHNQKMLISQMIDVAALQTQINRMERIDNSTDHTNHKKFYDRNFKISKFGSLDDDDPNPNIFYKLHFSYIEWFIRALVVKLSCIIYR